MQQSPDAPDWIDHILRMPNSAIVASIAKKDWKSTPLGSVYLWPENLTNVLQMLLASAQPLILWWGDDNIVLYNDAAIPLLGSQHPNAFGKPASEIWPDTTPPGFSSFPLLGNGATVAGTVWFAAAQRGTAHPTDDQRATSDTRFLAELGERLRVSDDADQLVAVCVDLIGPYLGAGRAFLPKSALVAAIGWSSTNIVNRPHSHR